VSDMTWRGMWRFLGWGQYPLILVGGVVGLAAEVLFYAAHHPTAALTAAFGFLAAGCIVETARRRHGHCDRCGRCSLGDGIPARRLTSNRLAELRAGGWTAGNVDLCADCTLEASR
jgi:hypothetical protein